MSISTAGLIGAVIAVTIVVFGYVSPRAFFRQRLAQFDPAEGEKQRELLRRGLDTSRHPLYSPWVQLPMRMIAAAIAGYLVGRLFE
jgi:protein-S-isoprenylcysteine O-methyltransferase Ste14